jgi:23S rRNA (guanosine2251-2'-O)-methyltransferase
MGFQDRRHSPRPPQKNNLIAGIHPLMEAIRSGQEIDKVLVKKGMKGDSFNELRQMMRDHGIQYQQVPPEKLDSITRANHQGVIAFTAAIEFQDLDHIVSRSFEAGKTLRLLLLDSVTDVRNFGAITRSAECQGFDAVIIPDKGAAQINEDAVKTSAGALMHIAVCRVKSLVQTVHYLKDSGVQVLACSEKTEQPIYAFNLTLPTCIIMGSEEKGIAPELIKISHHLATIPMFGRTSSLNVGVAAGMIMYEMNRQRSAQEASIGG